jgi:hypothetical protein
MQRGYSIDDSTLTAASAINWGNNLVPATSDGERIKDMMAWDAVEKSQMAVASGMPCTYRTFLVTEGVARDLAAAYHTKDALEKALVETARIPLGSRAFANYWGNPGSAFDPSRHPLESHADRIASAERAQDTSTPPWLAWTGARQMETVPAMIDGKSAFLVTGDSARNKELCVPGGGFATVKIVLPKAWDSLMAERGYEPLAKFRLATDMTPDTPRPRVRPPTHAGARGDFGARRSGGQGRGYRQRSEGGERNGYRPRNGFRGRQRNRE